LLGCWFIVERARERAFSSLRRGHFCRARACIPRLLSSTEIEATSTTLNAGRTVWIEQVVQQVEQAQKSRQGTVRAERPYCTDFRIPYSRKKKGMEIEAEKYSLYCTDSVRSVRLLFRHRNRGEGSVLFSGSLACFPRRSYNIYCTVLG
jgi:hypothetical protein